MYKRLKSDPNIIYAVFKFTLFKFNLVDDIIRKRYHKLEVMTNNPVFRIGYIEIADYDIIDEKIAILLTI